MLLFTSGSLFINVYFLRGGIWRIKPSEISNTYEKAGVISGGIFMPYIKYIYAREVLDSRGIPTVEAQVYTHCGVCGSADCTFGRRRGNL